MAKKTEEKLEKEYVIPLRGKFQHVARYKKTPKAVKSVKEFLARHMKIYDRNLDNIKLDSAINEFLWARGIKNPPHKIKVRAKKQGQIVRVELVDLPNKLKFKKEREEKIETEAKARIESKKSMMQKAKETMQNRGKEDESKEGDKDKDGVEDKKEEKEKKTSVVEAGKKLEKEMAKKAKHTTKVKTPGEKRIEIKQPQK